MDDAEIQEMFSALGPIAIRRMFGGKGVYHAGLIVAVELRGEMRLKANDRTARDFEAAGATRWTYEGRGGKTVAMPYWSVPDDAFDDPDVMARWVELAYAAARGGARGAAAEEQPAQSNRPRSSRLRASGKTADR